MGLYRRKNQSDLLEAVSFLIDQLETKGSISVFTSPIWNLTLSCYVASFSTVCSINSCFGSSGFI